MVDSPVSLRDLPATVVDLLGLSAGSPFPGRSLAAYWGSGPGPVPPEITSPALSEQADAAAFQPQPRQRPRAPGFQMSLVASGHHYIRDGMGLEQLYDLRIDPFERVNLMASRHGGQRVGAFRRMLLEVLTDNPGSVEVEKAYLETLPEMARVPRPGRSTTDRGLGREIGTERTPRFRSGPRSILEIATVPRA